MSNKWSGRTALLGCVSVLAIASVSTPSYAEQQLIDFYVNGLNGGGSFQTGCCGAYNGKAFDTNNPVGPGDTIDHNTLPNGFDSTSSVPGSISEASGHGHGTAGGVVTGVTADDAYDGYGGVGLEGMTHFGGLTVTRDVEATHGPGDITTPITAAFTSAGIPNAARWVDTFTNNTGSTISGMVATANNLGSDSNTQWVVVGPNNNYLISVQAGSSGADPVVAHVLGNNAYTAAQTEHYANGDDNPVWRYDLSVAPGETKRIVIFNILVASTAYDPADKTPDIAYAQQLAEQLTNNGNPLPINSPFFTGYTAAELLQVVNWDFEAASLSQETEQSLAVIANAVPQQITGDILRELSNLRIVGDTDPSGFASSSASDAANVMVADASTTMTDAGKSLYRIATADTTPALGSGDSERRASWNGNGWRGFGLVSGFTGKRGAGADVAGIKYDGFSATLGGDYLLWSDTRVGAALSYAEANADVSANLGSSNLKSYVGSLYFSHSFTPFLYLDGVGLVGWNDYKYDRVEGPDRAHADTGGLAYGLNIVTGFDVPVAPSVKAGPYLSLAYSDSEVDSYSEKGAGIADLQVDKMHIRSGNIEAGGKISYRIAQSWGTLVPQAQLGLRRGIGGDTNSVTSQYVDTPTSLTTSNFRNDSGTSVVTGLAIAGAVSQQLELKLAYTGAYGDASEHNTLSLRAVWSF